MRKFLLFLTALLVIPHCICNEENDYEAAVVIKILTDYSTLVRPSNRVEGTLVVSLKQIVNLDERNEILTTSSNIYCEWNDPRLTWDPSENGGVNRTLIPAKKLWLPDLVITNSADSDIFLKVSDYSNALVNFNGTVGLTYSASLLKTRCPMNLDKFPFDKQTCTISIGSWSHDKDSIAFTNSYDITLNLAFYIPNSVWDLNDDYSIVLSEKNDRFADFDGYDITDVNINIELSRRPLYFMINSVFPCLVLNILTLLTFGLPSGPQYSITTSIFLTFSVYSLRTVSDMPTEGASLPTIYLFYLFSSSFTLVSFTWFTLDNILRSQAELPALLNKLGSKMPKIKSRKHLELQTLENEASVENINLPNEDTENVTEINKDTVTEKKPSCDKCEFCYECQKKQDKEAEDKKLKKEFERIMKFMNRSVFLFLFALMLTANLVIWIYLSS